MTLNQQVISLELAKKLKDLGIKQESYFHYYGSDEEIRDEKGYAVSHLKNILNDYSWATKISAFTIAELGEFIIPWFDQEGEFPETISPEKPSDVFSANYYAKVICYLLENNLIQL